MGLVIIKRISTGFRFSLFFLPYLFIIYLFIYCIIDWLCHNRIYLIPLRLRYILMISHPSLAVKLVIKFPWSPPL